MAAPSPPHPPSPREGGAPVLEQASPEQAGHGRARGAPSAFGRTMRVELEGGIELFRFDANDRDAVVELLAFAGAGVGGCFGGGEDDRGPWVVRRDDPSLAR